MMLFRKTANFFKAFLLVVLFSSPAFAISLDDAKNRLLVGEKLSGYIGAISSNPSDEVKKLVDEINRKRKEKYQEIAKDSGTSLDVVEKLAAKKAIEKTPKGEMVEVSPGTWLKKQ